MLLKRLLRKPSNKSTGSHIPSSLLFCLSPPARVHVIDLQEYVRIDREQETNESEGGKFGMW